MEPKTVMCFGAFDILHPGHLSYLKQAKALGDYLIVIVARDQTIEKVKGRPPHHKEQQRLAQVQEVNFVDKALLGDVDDPYRIIEEQKPDLICLGYDQNSFSKRLPEVINDQHIDSKIVRLKPYKEHIYKSSKIKAR